MKNYRHPFALIFLVFLFATATVTAQNGKTGKLHVSANHHFLVKEDGTPFFWLGDTGWLLFSKLNREEAVKYLEDRRKKGFNVIQVMVLHGLGVVNAYGDSALINKNVATPKTTEGASPSDSLQYDYWDHIDYIIDMAAEKGLYMGLVPVWGTNVKSGWVNEDKARTYAGWLAERYKKKTNIVWLNGGDIKGSDSMNVWKAIGNTIDATDSNHLITFHPFGRTTSSTWFHNEPWLDFNMFQSGHRSYEQDTAAAEHRFGPDNWKFVQMDYNKKPVKPTLDGEPSYEHIPYGLHDTAQPRWKDSDVRRYGYWSVFTGGAGYTYGHNSVMQMHKPSDKGSAYGSRYFWYNAINHPGAGQMVHLKNLMLSKAYLDRVPDQSLIAGKNGDRYDYLVGTRGKDYAFIYTYNGRTFGVNMGKIEGKTVRAYWYCPRKGTKQAVGTFPNKGVVSFNPPGVQKDGNDWVLVLERAE
jgi:hypothetical protein